MDVSLRMFYNVGRLPLRLYHVSVKHGRVWLIISDHDKTPLQVSQGVFLCRYCGEVIKSRSRLFCNVKCMVKFNKLTQEVSWDMFRWMVFKRDRYHCKVCGKSLRKKKYVGKGYDYSSFVCDHIIPLFKGGRDWWHDPCMLNFQTLCITCNKQKTASDLSKPRKPHLSKKLFSQTHAYTKYNMSAESYHKLEKFMEATL